MIFKSNNEREKFIIKWKLFNALGLIIITALDRLLSFLALENMHQAANQSSSIIEQTAYAVGFVVFAGFVIGMIQNKLMKKHMEPCLCWVNAYILGFVLVEIISGIICWKMNINRAEIGFLEGNPFGNALLVAIAGGIAATMHLRILKKEFSHIFYWIPANILGWSIPFLLTAFFQFSMTLTIITFLLGSLIFGFITAITIAWIFNHKTMID